MGVAAEGGVPGVMGSPALDAPFRRGPVLLLVTPYSEDFLPLLSNMECMRVNDWQCGGLNCRRTVGAKGSGRGPDHFWGPRRVVSEQG